MKPDGWKNIVAVLLLSAPLAALAKEASPDESFYEHAAEAGVAEVEAGRVAVAKGASRDVKDFAAMMVKDHGAANEKLKSIAMAKGIKLPAEPGLKHKAMKKIMEMKSGESFDKDCISGQIKDHQGTIELLKKEIAAGQDVEAKAFASEMLPTVQMHLEKIQGIAMAHDVKE